MLRILVPVLFTFYIEGVLKLNLYIYSTNIGTEHFKHAAHSPSFSLQSAVYFIMLPFFSSCIIHILHTGCAKI
jgi:hypothetical protein